MGLEANRAETTCQAVQAARSKGRLRDRGSRPPAQVAAVSHTEKPELPGDVSKRAG